MTKEEDLIDALKSYTFEWTLETSNEVIRELIRKGYIEPLTEIPRFFALKFKPLKTFKLTYNNGRMPWNASGIYDSKLNIHYCIKINKLNLVGSCND